jgi:hypothetical protein
MNGVTLKTTFAGQPGRISGTTGTSTTVIVAATPPAQQQQQQGGPAAAPRSLDLEGAVYTYLRAMRSLNRTHVSPEDVANALAIPVSTAMAALTSLKAKGVRRSR